MYYSFVFSYLIYCVEIYKGSTQIIFRSSSENPEEMHQNYFLFGIFSSLRATISEIKYFKLRKTRNTKNKFNDV